MKYKLSNNTKLFEGRLLYQIEAIKDFGDVKSGDLGGWIEQMSNLSHEGSCWVGENAMVYDQARVHENARVYGSARVFGKAYIYGDGQVFGDANVFERSAVCDFARVCGFAEVCGTARVVKTGVVSESHIVTSGFCHSDLSKDLIESIRCQTGLIPINNKVILYQQVKANMASLLDDNFRYEIGEVAEVSGVFLNNKHLAEGLRGHNVNHWSITLTSYDTGLIAIEVNMDDIVSVEMGVVKFKKGLVLDFYKLGKK